MAEELNSPKGFTSRAMQAIHHSMGVDMVAVLNNVASLNDSTDPGSEHTTSVAKCMQDIKDLESVIKSSQKREEELKRDLQELGISFDGA